MKKREFRQLLSLLLLGALLLSFVACGDDVESDDEEFFEGTESREDTESENESESESETETEGSDITFPRDEF